MQTHSHEGGSRRERIRSVLWAVIAIVVGWSAFFFSWWRVLGSRRDVLMLLSLLAWIVLITDAVLFLSILWIMHNRRLARREKRLACAYIPPSYDHDKAARELVLPSKEKLQEASIVIVTATRKRKIFSTIASAE